MQAFAFNQWAARNWFVLLLPILLLFSFQFVASVDWARDGRTAELVILFDACVSLPLLYFLCYRTSLSARQMALRLIGVACLGVWIATWLVPEASQSLLLQLSWARTAGFVILAAIELRLVVAAIRLAFSGKATSKQLSEASGAPPWIAKLMLLEARFWRAVWRFIRGR